MLAQGIPDNKRRHRSRESAHYRLMKSVAGLSTSTSQFKDLRRVKSSLVHAQTLFHYLRDNQGGKARAALCLYFAVGPIVSMEYRRTHDRFLAAASSNLCDPDLGVTVRDDPSFQDRLTGHDSAHFGYFSVYCDRAMAESACREQSSRSLLLLLTEVAMQQRADPLAAPWEPSRRLRMVGRSAHGDSALPASG